MMAKNTLSTLVKEGGATYAAECGLDEENIRVIGDWKNVQTAQLYIDHSTPLRIKRVRQLQQCI